MDLDEVVLFLHLRIFRIMLALIKDVQELLKSTSSVPLFYEPADTLRRSRDSGMQVANRTALTKHYNF